jgi:Zn/Cd-binding protein ZinT
MRIVTIMILSGLLFVTKMDADSETKIVHRFADTPTFCFDLIDKVSYQLLLEENGKVWYDTTTFVFRIFFKLDSAGNLKYLQYANDSIANKFIKVFILRNDISDCLVKTINSYPEYYFYNLGESYRYIKITKINKKYRRKYKLK